MTIKELILEIQNRAINISGVHSVKVGDVYDILNNKQCVYPAVIITPISVDLGEDVNTANISFYFIDRLIQDQSNQLDVFSNTTIFFNELIDEIDKISGVGNINIPNMTFFSQQFGDYCAGGYIELGIEIKVEKNCRK